MKKIYKFIFINICLFAMISGCVTNSTVPSEKVNTNVNVYQAKEMTDQGIVFILDVRSENEYDSGHLKGATRISLQELNISEKLNDIPEDKMILVYSSDKEQSIQACEILSENGFPQIYNMIDGIDAWVDAGFEVDK